MDIERISALIESLKVLISHSKNLNNEIDSIRYVKLKISLRERMQTIQADLLDMQEYLFELLECETLSEIDLLINKTELIEPE